MTSRHDGRSRLVGGLLALMLCFGAAFGEASYTVKRGDTLAELANRFSVPLSELITLNQIENPDLLLVGQILTLPDGTKVPAVDATATGAAEDAGAAAAPDRPLTGRALMEERARLLAKQRGEQIVATARTFTGAPYRRGGLSSRGIDCSGLVVRALGAQGLRVPHHSATLYKMGTPVKYEALHSGDLLFFNTNGRGISHVGIWIGNNRFIHASSSGRGVVVDEVAGYYARRLVGARRLHNETE